jgi:hypothetical protein
VLTATKSRLSPPYKSRAFSPTLNHTRSCRTAQLFGAALAIGMVTAPHPAIADESVSAVNRDFAAQIVVKHGFLYGVNPSTRRITRVAIGSGGDRVRINLPSPEILWQGEPLIKPIGIAVDDDDVIYIVDADAHAVFVKRADASLEPLIADSPLVSPSGVAIIKNDIYVADPGARAIFLLHIDSREVTRIFNTTADSTPWKILASNNRLLGLDSNAKSLVFLIPNAAEDRSENSVSTLRVNDPGNWKSQESNSDTPSSRGELLRLNTNLRPYLNASDFTVSGSIIYFLIPTGSAKQAITMYPLLGGGTSTFVVPAPSMTSWTALSEDDTRLFLANADQATSIPLVVPASLTIDARLSSESLVDLYNYLLNCGLLQVKHYDLEDGDSVARVIQKKLVLPAGYTKRFDAIFCRMNQRHCSRGGKPQRYLQPGDSIDLPYIGLDSLASRRSVTLPFIPDQYADPRFVRHVGGTLGDLAREFALSGTSNSTLRNELKQLNYSYKGQDILQVKVGTFLVPVQLLSATFAAPKRDVEDRQSEFYALKRASVSLTSPTQFDAITIKSLPAAAGTLVAPLAGQRKDDNCVQLPPRVWTRALEIIHYCDPVFPRGLGNVAVVDWHFDPTHPEFQEPGRTDSALIPYEPQPSIERRTIHGSGPTQTDWDWDHGTHLAALIGARGNSKEMIGVDPRSNIYAIKIGEFPRAVDKEYGLHIYNISLGDGKINSSTAADAFRDIVKKDGRQSILFVLAAGNDGGPVNESSLAGLGNRENVLVVGATDESDPPKLWDKSNYDSKFVNIAAPGTDIRSAAYGGGYEFGSGTSQATALVSGAATLLATVEPSWEPWRIKERLMSTADLWTGGAAGKVFSGVLNIKAAVLDTRAAVFKLHSGDICVSTVNYIGDSNTLKLNQAGHLAVPIHHSDIRRIYRHSDGITFSIVASRISDDKKDHSMETYEVLGDDFDGVVDLRIYPGSAGCHGKTKIRVTDIDDLVNGFY